MMACVRFHVTGRVQGVWYRAATREQAQRLGLAGHALNLPDGRVEVLACGTQEAIEALHTWLWQGPPRARVDAVERTTMARSECPAQPGEFITG